MRTRIDEQLLAETARYELRYTCEHCAHFAVEPGHCSLFYPNEEHLASSLTLGQTLVYCKEFDLV